MLHVAVCMASELCGGCAFTAYGTWLVEQPVPECIIDQTRRHWNPQNSGRVCSYSLFGRDHGLPRRQEDEHVLSLLAGSGVDNVGHHSCAAAAGQHGVQHVPGLHQPAQLVCAFEETTPSKDRALVLGVGAESCRQPGYP